jgi:hypothetical protein
MTKTAHVKFLQLGADIAADAPVSQRVMKAFDELSSELYRCGVISFTEFLLAQKIVACTERANSMLAKITA